MHKHMTIGLCPVFLLHSVILHATNVPALWSSALMLFSFSLSLSLFICGVFPSIMRLCPAFHCVSTGSFFFLGSILEFLERVKPSICAGEVFNLNALAWDSLWMRALTGVSLAVPLSPTSLASLVLLVFCEPVYLGSAHTKILYHVCRVLCCSNVSRFTSCACIFRIHQIILHEVISINILTP